MHRHRNAEKTLIGGLRAAVFILLITALAIPQIVFPVKAENIIFLIDRSASFASTEENVLDWLDVALEAKKVNQSFSIISFADGTAIEQSMDNKKAELVSFTGTIDKGETNIEDAIDFARNMLGQNNSGRIVLVTDGNETAGNSKEAAKLLKNQQVELDYVEVEQKFREDVAVSNFETSPTIYEGEKAKLTVTIDSNADKTAELRISFNNRDIKRKKITLKQGRNEFSFSHIATEPGLSIYKAEVIASQDAYVENNSLYAVSQVKGTPKILVVQGNQQDSLAKLLTSSGVKVDQLIPEKLPTTMTGMLQYQSIIFNNVPATKMTEQQMLLIEKAVKEFGTGFIMLGGEESFGLGGYFKTPIEKLLPVNMDIKGKKQLPSLGLVIVIDRSGSMGGNKLTLAKEAAARSVELLREDDHLGFIAFDDRPWVIVETAPLKNKKKTIDKIRTVSVGGGTNIYPALEEAYQQLNEQKLQRKHIILLTDGQSAADGDYEGLIATGKKQNITLSTVALGADADRLLLEELAVQGSGRFYDVTDASVIPSILSRETVMTTRTYIEDKPFYPQIQPYPGWLELFQQGVPKMNAYIAVTAKNRAELPLLSEKKDPILAEWQYGLGTTLAYTSDVTGKWSGDWPKWGNWSAFVNQMVTKSLPKYESEPVDLTVAKQSDQVIVHLTSANNQYPPKEVMVVSQAGEVMDTNLKPTAPGEYDVSFPHKPGMYFFRSKQITAAGKETLFQTGFSVPYSEEYLLSPRNQVLLRELTTISDGKKLMSPKEAFRPLKYKQQKTITISTPILLAAFLLFFVEIFIRRLGLQPFYPLVKLFKSVRQPLKQGQTMTAAQMSTVAVAKDKSSFEQKPTAIQEQQAAGEKRKLQAQKQDKQELMSFKSSEDKSERLKRLLEAKQRRH